MIEEEKELTVREAYAVMVAFLEDYLSRTNADDIAILLAELEILEDGGPRDPALWNEWKAAAAKAVTQPGP